MAESKHTTRSVMEAVGFIKAFGKKGIKVNSIAVVVDWERTIESSPDK